MTVACFGMSVGAFPDAERAGLASAPLAERYFFVLTQTDKPSPGRFIAEA